MIGEKIRRTLSFIVSNGCDGCGEPTLQPIDEKRIGSINSLNHPAIKIVFSSVFTGSGDPSTTTKKEFRTSHSMKVEKKGKVQRKLEIEKNTG